MVYGYKLQVYPNKLRLKPSILAVVKVTLIPWKNSNENHG